jgi:hypothetical protein
MTSTRLAVAVALSLAVPAFGADLDREPIRYSSAPGDNAVSRLQGRLDAGWAKLQWDEQFGYLPSLLQELRVSKSSQVLVFSKTSLQRERIGPTTPRAIYFGDDAYVGFCRQGRVLEVTAVDPQLGAVFYSLDQERTEKPRFVRQNDACLICHGSSQNQGFPGHLVRSVLPDGQGYPILSAGTYRIDQTSELKRRWGGWYVSGRSGAQRHLGNLVVRALRPPAMETIDNESGANVTDLSRFFTTAPYLTPHSDIVALMVLEHQAEMQNLITRAGFQTRLALHEEAEINKALGRPADYRSETTSSRVRGAGEPLVRYLLFSGEAALTDRIEGTSAFAREFVARGPRDGKGRSLRDLDLRRRLFVYPCSCLIYSPEFDALPDLMKDYVYRRLREILTGRDASKEFAHLSDADRTAIRDILLATKPSLPASWKAAPPH